MLSAATVRGLMHGLDEFAGPARSARAAQVVIDGLRGIADGLGRIVRYPEISERAEMASATAHKVIERLQANSRESLEELLRKVWQQRKRVIREANNIIRRNEAERAAAEADGRRPRVSDPSDPVYKLYSHTTEANPLTGSAEDLLTRIVKIAHGRPAHAISNTQITREPIEELARTGRLTSGNYDKDFFRFVRAGADLQNIAERIYLNIKADHAPEVMRTVVREIIDNPTQFPGVPLAKLRNPTKIGRRAEVMVIYATDAAAVERVMVRIRAYHAAKRWVFQETTPYMTNRVLKGVSLGAEPDASFGGGSFGGIRAFVIYDALRKSVENGYELEKFMSEVLEGLPLAGIDPEAPHLNLPPVVRP